MDPDRNDELVYSRYSTTMRGLAELGMWPYSYIQYEDMNDKEIYGFPRRKIIYDIKRLLVYVQCAVGREDKINGARDMFAYLATTDSKKFIQTYKTFGNAVKNKLIEFRYRENLREAQRWWRDIFGTRIPIES